MKYRRFSLTPRTPMSMLVIVALLSFMAVISVNSAFALEPTLRTRLDLNTPATTASGTSSGFTLHWSVNDVDTPKTTIAMSLPVGAVLTPNTFDNTVLLPATCGAGSSVAADGHSFVCELGPKQEGTWGAFDVQITFAGQNNQEFNVSFTLSNGTTTTTSNAKTVKVSSTPQAEILLGSRYSAGLSGDPGSSYSYGLQDVTDQNGVHGRVVWFPIKIEIPSNAEPVTSATFTSDWTTLKTAFPHIRPIDFTVAQTPGQQFCKPNNLLDITPYGSVGINPQATASNSANNSGTWTCATSGSQTTVTVSGISVTPSNAKGEYGANYRVISAGTLGFFIPETDVPVGTRSGDNVIKDITFTTASGAHPSDTNTPNNSSQYGTMKFPPGLGVSATAGWTQDFAYYTATSATNDAANLTGKLIRWVQSSHGFNIAGYLNENSLTFAPTFSTNYDNRYNMHFHPASNGGDLVSAGSRYYATSQLTIGGYDTRIAGDLAQCAKWDPTYLALASAPSTVSKAGVTLDTPGSNPQLSVDGVTDLSTPGTNPAHPYAIATMQERLKDSADFGTGRDLYVPGYQYGRDFIIEYGTVSNASSSGCSDADSSTGWHQNPSDVSGTVNAVRAITLGDKNPPVGKDYQWTLDVPLTVNVNTPTGTIIGFYSAQNLLDAQPLSASSVSITDAWTGPGLYTVADHSGDGRYGSRAKVGGTSLSFVKTSERGTTFVLSQGDEIEFTLKATVHGNRPITLSVDDYLGSSLEYVPGSSSISTTSSASMPTSAEPTVGTDSTTALGALVNQKLTWNIGTVSNVSGKTFTIKYKARAKQDAQAGSYGVNAAVARGGENPGGAQQVTPSNPDGAASGLAFTIANGYWELNVHKDVAGGSPIPVGGVASYELKYSNRGSKSAESVTFIDVLPFNNDGTAPLLGENDGGRKNQTAFTGTAVLQKVEGTNETFLYTKAAPTTISLDPSDATNNLSSGATKWCEKDDFGSTGCPTALSDVTAIRFVTGSELAPDQERSVKVHIKTDGNKKADQYTNNFGAKVDPQEGTIGVPVLRGISNDVTIVVDQATDNTVVTTTTAPQVLGENVSRTPTGSLPFTGVQAMRGLAWGILLVGFGSLLLQFRRTKKTHTFF